MDRLAPRVGEPVRPEDGVLVDSDLCGIEWPRVVLDRRVPHRAVGGLGVEPISLGQEGCQRVRFAARGR